MDRFEERIIKVEGEDFALKLAQSDNDLIFKLAFKGHLDHRCIDQEVAMWNFIVKLADELLSKYPTTLEEDDEILRKDDEDH